MAPDRRRPNNSARLGVGTLTLIDDIVTDPTPIRGYGVTTADIGRPKAEVLSEHVRRIGPGTTVTAVTSPVQHPDARRAFARPTLPSAASTDTERGWY